MQGLAARCGDASLLEKPDLLRLPAGRVHAFRDCYLKFQYPPMVDNINLHSYFMNVDARNQLKDQNAEMIGVLWTAFEIQSMLALISLLPNVGSDLTFCLHLLCRCYIQEIISCLVLLSEEAWPERLSLLFDIFSCSGGDELGYDDLVMALQVVAVALHRLWVTGEWDQTRWSHVIETLADSAYAKVWCTGYNR